MVNIGSAPRTINHYVIGGEFPMCGLSSLRMANSMSMSVYRLTRATQLFRTRLVSTSHISLPQLGTSNKHSYQLHGMNPLPSDGVWLTIPIPPWLVLMSSMIRFRRNCTTSGRVCGKTKRILFTRTRSFAIPTPSMASMFQGAASFQDISSHWRRNDTG